MDSQTFNLLDGKLRRTAYAVVWDHLLTHTDTLTKEQVDYLSERVKSAISDAVENSIEYMEEYGIIRFRTAPKKKKAKQKR
jgi:hypothetical protein